VRSCNASDGPAIDPHLASHSESVDEELKNSFHVDLLLVRVVVGGKDGLLGLAIASVVPHDDIGVSPDEEVEPVGTGLSDHALVDESIGVAHYNRRLIQVLLRPLVLPVTLQSICVRVQLHLVAIGAGEEHAVEFRLASSLDGGDLELTALKGALHDDPALLQVSEQYVVVVLFVDAIELPAATEYAVAHADEVAQNATDGVATPAGLNHHTAEFTGQSLQLPQFLRDLGGVGLAQHWNLSHEVWQNLFIASLFLNLDPLGVLLKFEAEEEEVPH
jgi:hypothetical protein